MAGGERAVIQARIHLEEIHRIGKKDSPLSTLHLRSPLRNFASEILSGLVSDRRSIVSALPEFSDLARQTPGNETIRGDANSLADVLDAIDRNSNQKPPMNSDIDPALKNLRDTIGSPDWDGAYSGTVDALADGIINYDPRRLHDSTGKILLTSSDLLIDFLDTPRSPSITKHLGQLSGLATVASSFDGASVITDSAE